MSPREAADRLFDRAMREQESGDPEQARFFAQMGVQAYDRVPPAQIDLDTRFHIGLLQLVQGNADAAEVQAETILSEAPGHLLGLILAARVAEARGLGEAAESLYRRVRAGIEAGALEERPEYGPHRAFIEREAETGGGGP